jgi:hypothetical protein
MKICYRNGYWCLSRPSRVRWAAEKIVRKCSVPGVVSAQSVLSVSVQFLFFLLRSRGVLWQNERAGIFKFKIVKRKNVNQDAKGRSVFALLHFVFSSYFITIESIKSTFLVWRCKNRSGRVVESIYYHQFCEQYISGRCCYYTPWKGKV